MSVEDHAVDDLLTTIEGLGQENTDLVNRLDSMSAEFDRLRESFQLMTKAYAQLQNAVLQTSEGIRLLRNVPLQHLDDAVTEVADQVQAVAIGP